MTEAEIDQKILNLHNQLSNENLTSQEYEQLMTEFSNALRDKKILAAERKGFTLDD